MNYLFSELVKCAERELKMRCAVYPKRVNQNAMTQEKATEEIAMMREIAAHLREEAEKEKGQGALELWKEKGESL